MEQPCVSVLQLREGVYRVLFRVSSVVEWASHSSKGRRPLSPWFRNGRFFSKLQLRPNVSSPHQHMTHLFPSKSQSSVTGPWVTPLSASNLHRNSGLVPQIWVLTPPPSKAARSGLNNKYCITSYLHNLVDPISKTKQTEEILICFPSDSSSFSPQQSQSVTKEVSWLGRMWKWNWEPIPPLAL